MTHDSLKIRYICTYFLGTSDYFGLNHFNTHYVEDEADTTNYGTPHFDKDLQATIIYTNDSWQQADDASEVRTSSMYSVNCLCGI